MAILISQVLYSNFDLFLLVKGGEAGSYPSPLKMEMARSVTALYIELEIDILYLVPNNHRSHNCLLTLQMKMKLDNKNPHFAKLDKCNRNN